MVPDSLYFFRNRNGTLPYKHIFTKLQIRTNYSMCCNKRIRPNSSIMAHDSMVTDN